MPKGEASRPFNRDQKIAKNGSGKSAQHRRELANESGKKTAREAHSIAEERRRKAAGDRERSRRAREEQGRSRAASKTGHMLSDLQRGTRTLKGYAKGGMVTKKTGCGSMMKKGKK